MAIDTVIKMVSAQQFSVNADDYRCQAVYEQFGELLELKEDIGNEHIEIWYHPVLGITKDQTDPGTYFIVQMSPDADVDDLVSAKDTVEGWLSAATS